VEGVFGVLQIVTAAFVAFAHGANDVANAVGPLAAVVGIAQVGFQSVPTEIPVPIWILALGGVGIVVGLATWGYKVIVTIGKHITELTPTRGFSAEFGAAGTVLLASRLGLPISTTHTLVGSVIGVGFAQGIGALNLRTVRNIINSWVATLPAAAALSGLLYWILKTVLL
jgi:phosphate/sulfate permease